MIRLALTVAVIALSGCTSLGPEGAPGAKGDSGDAGPPGPKGDTGAAGPKGDTGPVGPTGATGPQGLQGPQGDVRIIDGGIVTGPPGSSVLVTSINPGSECAAGGIRVTQLSDGGIATVCNGVKGDTGLTGIQGPKGDTGLTGIQGPTGDTGAQGPKGDTGSNSLWAVNGTTMSYSGGNIGIGTATPDALLQVHGPIRLGSETGTSEGPNTGNGLQVGYKGMVIRRIASTAITAGSIVASTSEMTLERDGTAGGFQVRWIANGSATLAIRGTITNTSGTVTGVHFETGNQFTGGTQAIFAQTDNIIFAHLIFGNFYNADNVTEVTIARSSQFGVASDNVWIGTVMSSYNQ